MVPRDVQQVIGQVGLQIRGAREEAGHQAEQLPSVGAGGSVEVRVRIFGRD